MAVMNKGFKQYELKDGLVVALQPTPTQTIAAKLRVNYGCVHERKGEEGMAHFLEHCLVTGGSRKYNPVGADEVRGCFGEYNASTCLGRTFFDSQMLPEDFGKWIDFVSDHVIAPRFDEERVDGERKRVLREISDKKSSPDYSSSIEFNELFFRGHPKGIFILGKEDVVRDASIEKIREFHSRGYHVNNMDLIVAGALTDQTEELIERYFGLQFRGENTRIEFPLLLPLQKKTVIYRPAPEKLNTDNPEDSSADVSLAFVGPAQNHEDEYAVRVMSRILGGDANSFLFQSLGLKKGLAYDVRFSYGNDYNAGGLIVFAKVPAKQLNYAVDAIFEEIERIKSETVGFDVVERVRRKAKYHLAENFETNEGHISGIELKLDRGLTPELCIKGFDGVTPERVREVANKYLPSKDDEKYILCIESPLIES